VAYRALRDELDGDMRTTGEQADRIKVGQGGLILSIAGVSDEGHALPVSPLPFVAVLRGLCVCDLLVMGVLRTPAPEPCSGACLNAGYRSSHEGPARWDTRNPPSQDEVATLRNAAAAGLSEAEERMRAAVAEYEALQRWACC
jgi:hypothetical protein